MSLPRYSRPWGVGNYIRRTYRPARSQAADPKPAGTSLPNSPRAVDLREFAQVTLNASGTGRVSMGPGPAEIWQPQSAIVTVPQASKHIICTLSLGNASGPVTVIDTAQQGENDSSGKLTGQVIYFGTYIWAVWTAGNAGVLATLTVTGTKTT